MVERGTLFRSAVDVLRRAGSAMTRREIATALIADKAAPASRKQFMDLIAAIHVALRKRDGVIVVGEGSPAKWRWKFYENPRHPSLHFEKYYSSYRTIRVDRKRWRIAMRDLGDNRYELVDIDRHQNIDRRYSS